MEKAVPKNSPQAWAMVLLLTLFMIIAFADRAVLGFAAVPIMKDLNLQPSQFGLAASAMYWLYPIGGLAGGFAVNRWPAKWVLAVLATIWAVTQFLMLWCTTLNEVIVARVLLGLGEGPAYAVAMHACFKWFEDDRRALPSSVVSEGAAFGIIFASPIVAIVIQAFGWRAAFGMLGAVTLVWVVAWIVFGREGEITTASARSEHLTRVPYRLLLLDRTFLGNIIAGFAVACGITVFLAWLPPYLLKGLGYSAAQAGWLTSLPWAASILLVLAGSFLSQLLLRRGVPSGLARGLMLSMSLALGGAATVVMTFLEPGPLQLLFLALGFGLPTLVWTLGPAIIGEVTPVVQRGAMLGIFATIANTAAGSLAPYFMGLMVEAGATAAQGYARGFLLLGSLQLVLAFVALLLIRPQTTLAAFTAHVRATASLAGPQPIDGSLSQGARV
jgi:ACS family D-galactonate transporter-like MFS transporter